MANLKFKLRSGDPKKRQLIYVVYHMGKDAFKYSTKIKVLPAHWNKSKERLRDKLNVEGKNEINSFLDTLIEKANKKIIDYQTSNKEINKKNLKNIFDEILSPEPEREEQNPLTFWDFINSYLEKVQDKVNPKTGKTVCYQTTRKYYQCANELKNYEKIHHTILNFDSIDLEFYENFVDMLRKKNQSNNNIGKHIKTLKSLLNEATEKGINTNLKYKSHRFKAFTETADAIYLNEAELQKLYKLDLSNYSKLEKVRDLFLIGCYSGLRFGDFNTIKPELIKDGFLHIEQHKTQGKIIIPLHRIVIEILEKYEGILPKPISNQKFNDYLKELGKLAEINEPVYKSITKGGQRISTKYKKWELITSHSARRSFASNLYKSGFPAKSIMQITGHKTESSFMKYLKLSPDEHAKLLQLHWQKNGAFLKAAE